VRTGKWIVAAALFIAVAVVCLAAIELCETTVHLKPNRITIQNTENARTIASAVGARLEDVAIESSDGVPLKGWFFRSTNPLAEPVLLLHGQADNRKGMLGIASFLLRAGYHVLIPDARAHGDSGGDLASYGYRETGDVDGWLKWLDTHTKSECVYGLGRSMGAAILLQSLPEERRICSAVADSPFSSFREIGIYRSGLIFGANTYVPQLVVSAGFAYASLRYGLDFDRVSPEDAIARAKIPILLIHGTEDRSIPSSESETIFHRRSEHTELWQVPRVGHIGSYKAHPAEYETRVINWFRKSVPFRSSAHLAQ
jgi:alpha-beta hydrolase superfamily lysophospholipase